MPTSETQSTIRFVASLAFICFVATSSFLYGQNRAEVNAHLAAGEFGPAAALARQAADPALRDQLLRQVALAQASAGARRGALSTTLGIEDQGTRHTAMSNIAHVPLGGGGAQADFDTLIDLIKSTVAPQTWDDVGGPGAVDGFPGGVLVDAEGLLAKVKTAGVTRPLASLRKSSLSASDNADLRVESGLRKVSLRRLQSIQVA